MLEKRSINGSLDFGDQFFGGPDFGDHFFGGPDFGDHFWIPTFWIEILDPDFGSIWGS